MTAYQNALELLRHQQNTWLITGVAGFIGSHLLEALLRIDQNVVGIDNFVTGNRKNLVEVRARLGEESWRRFRFHEGDIRDLATCRDICAGVDIVLHQAALGSVPRSIEDPVASTETNINGTLNVLIAARDSGVRRLVYASSSSVYGDSPDLPKIEERTGTPLSPYAVTKCVNELHASVFSRVYGLSLMGLRYFNVFGPRQDPAGPYAAVIPRWISALLNKEPVYINGTGETSRDFCYVANVVQMNILAGTTAAANALNQVYNTAVQGRTSLNELYQMIHDQLNARFSFLGEQQPIYRDFRVGDVLHSEADIRKARHLLGYEPTHTVANGLAEALEWYVANLVP